MACWHWLREVSLRLSRNLFSISKISLERPRYQTAFLREGIDEGKLKQLKLTDAGRLEMDITAIGNLLAIRENCMSTFYPWLLLPFYYYFIFFLLLLL
jgi:hypothetical protein